MRFLLTLLISFFLVFSCVAISVNNLPQVNDIRSQLIDVTGDFMWSYKGGDSAFPGKIAGTIFSIGDGYFASAYHVFKIETVRVSSPIGIYEVEVDIVKPLKIKCKNHSYKIVSKNKEFDLVVLKSLDGFSPPAIAPTFKGDIQLLEKVLVVGTPRLSHTNTRLGHVSAFWNDAKFVIDTDLAPGDSGCPVFLMRSGRWYLAGVCLAIDYPTNSFALISKAYQLENMI